MASKQTEERYAEDGKNEKIRRNTTIKLRIYPTPEQAVLFEKTFGCCRYIWNRMLADEREFYAAADTHFIPTPAKYKKDAPFLKEVDSLALATVHQQLKRAFQRFFENPAASGYPSFKRKKDGRRSYTTFCQYFPSGPTVYVTGKGIRLPKAGVVKANFHRRPLHWWTLKSATVSQTPSGKYFCSLLYEYAEKAPEPVLPAPETTIGLHYSLPRFYVDSTGGAADPPHWLGRSEKKLAELQRRLSRMQPGSKNHGEQLQKIRLLHEHIANQRRDFIHKESRRIANAWDAVCVSACDLRGMSQTLPLGRVMDSGFGQFRDGLAYKLARQGKALISVEAAFPCAKTCHACGHILESLPLWERTWICPACGTALAREHNAAQNLRDRGLAQFWGEREA